MSVLLSFAPASGPWLPTSVQREFRFRALNSAGSFARSLALIVCVNSFLKLPLAAARSTMSWRLNACAFLRTYITTILFAALTDKETVRS